MIVASMIFIVLMFCISIFLIVFVVYFLRYKRSKRPVIAILESAFRPLGFQYQKLGAGGKWIGNIRGRKVTVVDFAEIQSIARYGAGANAGYVSRTHGAAAQFFIRVEKRGGLSMSIVDGVPIQDQRDISRRIGKEASARFARLKGPHFVDFVVIVEDQITVPFHSHLLSRELLLQIVDDLVYVAEITEQMRN